MYDGNQVLRFESKYKAKDLGGLGVELTQRKGTGNYDKERTKFNIKYKELEKDNLYQDVKYKLESRNIEYLHKNKTTLLNGVTISSGPEFFMTLGLPFKETDRKYKTGKKEGQNIWTPDIKSKDDIPEEVIKYEKLCEENDIELVLLAVPSQKSWSFTKYSMVKLLADSKGLEFIDFNIDNDLDIDWATETKDKGNHLNYWGAVKVSAYLGEYMEKTGLLTDHRGDSEYKSWTTAYGIYKEKLK